MAQSEIQTGELFHSRLSFIAVAISEIICSCFLPSWLWELVHPPCFVPFGFGNCSQTVYLVYWPWKSLRFASANCLRLFWLQIPNDCPDQASEAPPAPSPGKEIIFDFFGQYPSFQVHPKLRLVCNGHLKPRLQHSSSF